MLLHCFRCCQWSGIIIYAVVLFLWLPTTLHGCHPPGKTPAKRPAGSSGTAAGSGGSATGSGGSATGSGGSAQALPTMTTMATTMATPPPSGASCTKCSSDSLPTLSVPEAATLLADAILAEKPINAVGANSAGCTTITPNCAAGAVVAVRIGTIIESYDPTSSPITLFCNAQGRWIEANGVRSGQAVDAYACVTSHIPINPAPGNPVTTSAAASAALGQCSICDPAALGRTTTDEAKLPKVQLFDAIGISPSTSGVVKNAQGCTTLPLRCPIGQVVLIHVILKNRDTDFSVYDAQPGPPVNQITLQCSAEGKWLVPVLKDDGTPVPEHTDLQVDRYSCILSTTSG